MNKVFFVSLGCDKNLVDSEYMLGSLVKAGYEIVQSEEDADVIVVNTCSFICDARDESVETLLEMTRYKDAGSCKALIVCGCMAQAYGEDILKELPQVDAVIGTSGYDELVKTIESIGAGERKTVKKNLGRLPKTDGKRVSVTGGHYEYLKIAEGCQKNCTYCSIPKLRGPYRSVPMDRLVEEAEYLADRGVSELILVAQETTLYGIDIHGKKTLHELLRALCGIEALKRIRIMYCYPEEIYPELIDIIANEPKICNYIDMPIQHCNDEILRLMGRRTDKKTLLETIRGLRERIPDIILRTTLISGFPTETEEQHEELKRFIEEVRFDRLGVFAYSREDGTYAATLKGQIPKEIKERRAEELMLIQQSVSRENNEKRIGSETEVFVEGYIPEDEVYVGRTYADAPDVDGYIFFSSDKRLESGEFVTCRVTGASEYDLLGETI